MASPTASAACVVDFRLLENPRQPAEMHDWTLPFVSDSVMMVLLFELMIETIPACRIAHGQGFSVAVVDARILLGPALCVNDTSAAHDLFMSCPRLQLSCTFWHCALRFAWCDSWQVTGRFTPAAASG